MDGVNFLMIIVAPTAVSWIVVFLLRGFSRLVLSNRRGPYIGICTVPFLALIYINIANRAILSSQLSIAGYRRLPAAGRAALRPVVSRALVVWGSDVDVENVRHCRPVRTRICPIRMPSVAMAVIPSLNLGQSGPEAR